jgi:hypothetical protein
MKIALIETILETLEYEISMTDLDVVKANFNWSADSELN